MLSEKYEITMGQSPSSKNYTKDLNYPVLVQGNTDLKNGHVIPRIRTKEITKSIKKGSIILSVRAPVGEVAKNNFDVVLGRGVAGISGNNFIYQMLKLLKIKNFWLKYSSGSTFDSINSNDILHVIFRMPDKQEQEKIGRFFEVFDLVIQLEQKRLDLLKKLKKGFLQKMFPMQNKNIPVLRFAEFDQNWEQRKLGELASSFEYGLNVSAIEYDGENKYIRITDIDDSSHEFIQSCLTSPNIDLAAAENYLLKEGDVLFARTGASVGKTYHYKVEDGHIYYAGFLIRARIKPDFDSEFVFQNTLTAKYENFIRVTSQRSGQPGVNAHEYARFELSVPSLSEQKKVGQFLNTIDDTITLHQRKLTSLQKQKKSFLQKMFI